MIKLHQEIAKVFYRIFNDLVDSYYGTGMCTLYVEHRLLECGAVWTEEGWECPGKLGLPHLEIKSLPKIKSVGSHFNCDYNLLVDLKGCPKKVPGNFYCEYNFLTSLEGGPEKVEGIYSCFDNNLTTLQYGPIEVKGTFNCSNNFLVTLKHNKLKSVKCFVCSQNQLKNLKGSPEYVDVDFDCRRNLLETLEGGPTGVRAYFICSDNPQLCSLDFLPVNRGCVVLSDLGNRMVAEY